MTKFDEKHSDLVKLKTYSYCLSSELYEFVKKLNDYDSMNAELMLNFESVLNSGELLYDLKP